MSEADWTASFARSLGVFLNGEAIPEPDAQGEPVVDDSFYVPFNAHHEPLAFTLPARDWGRRWAKMLDTDQPLAEQSRATYQAGARVPVAARSVVVLRRIE